MKRTLIALTLLAAVPGLALAAPCTPVSRVPAAAGGGVDATQFRAMASERLMRMDTDHDGRVSQAEFSTGMAARKHGGGKGDGSRAFAKLDANHDGFLSADELGAMADRRFAKMDTNHDGRVDASERAAAHHGHDNGQPTGF